MITSLRLKDFKRHENLDLTFPEGLTLLTGPNFTGKSSILHGILYAMGGPAAIPGGSSVATRHGAKTPEVELEMVLGDHGYKVRRKGSSSTLWRDGEVVAKSASAVTAHLAEIVGMDSKRFRQLRYGEQKKTEALLTLGASELHSIIKEVSQATVIEDVIDKCSTLGGEYRGGLKFMPGADVDVELIQRELKDKTTWLHSAFAALEHLENSVVETKARVDVLEKNLIRATVAETEKIHNLERFGEYQKEKESLKLRLLDLPETVPFAQAETDLKAAEEGAKSVLAALAEADKDVSTLNNMAGNLKQLHTRLEGSTKQCDMAKDTLDKMEPEIPYRGLEEELTIVTNQLAVAESDRHRLELARSESICPTCKRPYKDDPEHLQAMVAEITSLTTQILKLIPEKKAIVDDIKHAKLHNESREQLARLLVRYKDTEQAQLAEYETLYAKYDTLQASDPVAALDRANKDGAVVRAALDEAHKVLLEAKEGEAIANTITTRLCELTDLITGIGEVAEAMDLGPMKQAVADLKLDLEDVTAVRDTRKIEYSAEHAKWEGMRDAVTAALEQEEQRKDLESKLATADGLAKYLRSNRDRFMASTWDGLLAYASTFASDSTGGVITAVKRTDNGSFTYVENDAEHPIDAASGAQKSVMGLGVQLALAQMLPSPMQTLLLDEPGSDFDPERSLAVTSLLAADHHQLIMVSHRELDGAVADQVIDLGAAYG